MFTRDELLAVARVRPTGGVLPMRFAGAEVDSRRLQRGEVFVALKGTQADGHRYIGAAVRAGAAAILCSAPSEEASARGVPQIIVADPLDILQRLAHQHLMRQPATRVIGVAGSNGKTSVKEAAAALLAHLGPTLKTEGNLNTETGLPMTLLRLNPEHQFAVLEMGAQRVGEVALLCRIAPPQIGVVTTVGPEHLEFFGSMENVERAEGEIVAALPAHGIAILNEDDRAVRRMAKRTRAQVITYGRRAEADVRAKRPKGETLLGLRFTLAYQGRAARAHLNIPGEHAVTTALAGAAVALACGMTVETAAAALSELRPAKRRGEIKPGVNGATLVDDTYNANRQSALAAIDLLRGAGLARGGRRWFVFGDMLELGSYAGEEHAEVGKAAVGVIDELVLVGEETYATAEAARKGGMKPEHIHYFAASLTDQVGLTQAKLAAAQLVRERLRPGDLVLVKGSLGVGMDVIVSDLQERHSSAHARADIGARLRRLAQFGHSPT
ncbi:MAG TPA: UDP-N-acetylmuramoyl-tripeptide--D-alanyl-D-alanine ligase [Ktedonobacterales bacterium]|nr:UDP-N-acetylmuramoyl-tripeptide--D-alanyl-D-alanine ligase [Ktedonobacterales bacterium]